MTVEIKYKRCTMCGKEKEIAAFSVKRANRDGYLYWCRRCRSQRRKNKPLVTKRMFILFLAEYNAKLCPRCKQIKPYRGFSKSKAERDGFNSYCRSCLSEKSAKRWRKEKDITKYKIIVRERSRKDRLKYPEKVKALNAINCAVRAKKLIRKKGFNFHHWSYLEENLLDVFQLMSTDHHKIHKYIKYEQEYKCYRAITGELLNSKQLHVDYVARIL